MFELLQDKHGPILLQTYDVIFNFLTSLTEARFVYIEHVQQVLLEEYIFSQNSKIKKKKLIIKYEQLFLWVHFAPTSIWDSVLWDWWFTLSACVSKEKTDTYF